MRDATDYLELPYRIQLVHDTDDEGAQGWVASIDELPGAFAQGETPDEAVERVHDAMLDWITVALEDNREIPEPRELKAYSGRFLLRLPRSLHADLARRAEEEGTSLNQFTSALIAYALGHRDREYA